MLSSRIATSQLTCVISLLPKSPHARKSSRPEKGCVSLTRAPCLGRTNTSRGVTVHLDATTVGGNLGEEKRVLAVLGLIGRKRRRFLHFSASDLVVGGPEVQLRFWIRNFANVGVV